MASLMRRTLVRTSAPIFNSLRRIVAQQARANWVCWESDAAQCADQDIGHRREEQPQLVGPHRPGRGAVGEEIELALLDAVFHLAAGAVDLLVEVAGVVLRARQRGNDKARIGLALGPLRLGDDPPLGAPAVARAPAEILEAACRLAGLLAEQGRLGEFGLDLADQPAVARQAEQEVDPVVLAPRHQLVAGKARIGAQQDTHLGPALAYPGDDPRRLLNAAGTAIDVGWAQLGRQQMPAAEHVKAAGRSNCRNSRGRSGPPDAHAAGHRWRRGRE
jgi:hypothetical protein